MSHLASECRRHGAMIRLGAAVAAIEETDERVAACCCGGTSVEADAAILRPI